MTMNKQITSIIFFTTFILLFAACSSDDGAEPVAPDTDSIEQPNPDNEAPVINTQSFTASEDIADDVIIGKISATDPEEDDLTFSLMQNSDDLFELTGTGELSLASGKALDYEEVTSYEITVEVSDGTDKTTTIITVNVENILDTPFVTTWKTTTANEPILIPISSLVTGDYDYSIDWGDGTVENAKTESGNHEYATPGTYTVSILGAFPAIRMEETGDGSDVPNKLQSIEQWGEIEWESFDNAFSGCQNMMYNATDVPNLSKVTDLTGIFAGCEKFNPSSLNDWDVSNIEEMQFAFTGATSFNGDLSQWDVSKVRNMRGMFRFASSFNVDIGQWNVSAVENMQRMFDGASSFDQDISNWDTRNVNSCDYFASGAPINGTPKRPIGGSCL